MTTARSSWKRLHTDLEDGDECLPISKRICSLHIESQTQGLHSQNNHGAHASSVDGFSGGSAAISSPLVDNSDQQFYSQPVTSPRLGQNIDLLSSARIHAHIEYDFSVQSELNQRHASAGPGPHFCRSISDPHSTYLADQLKLDPNFSQVHSRNLMFMPAASCDRHGHAQHSQQLSQSTSIQNEQSAVYCDFLGSIHNDSSTNPGHENMPDYSHEFHLQQLPTGIYEPELGMEENPYYFSVNQTLYEAHLCRVRRGNIFPSSS